MYIFPSSDEGSSHFQKKGDVITLKTYGLPYVFWFYAITILIVYFFLTLSIKEPVFKLIEIGGAIDKTLGYVFIFLMAALPIILLSFYFFEKILISDKKKLTIKYKVFFIPIYSKHYNLSQGEVSVRHFVDSPNMARIRDDRAMRAFYNQGYFELIFEEGDRIHLIDRSNRKADLERIKNLIAH